MALQRMVLCADKIGAILKAGIGSTAFPIYGGILFDLYQLASQSAFGVVLGLGTVLTSASLSGMCWLIAEGIEVFIAIEENTRQSALIAAQVATTAPPKEEMQQMAKTLASAT